MFYKFFCLLFHILSVNCRSTLASWLPLLWPASLNKMIDWRRSCKIISFRWRTLNILVKNLPKAAFSICWWCKLLFTLTNTEEVRLFIFVTVEFSRKFETKKTQRTENKHWKVKVRNNLLIFVLWDVRRVVKTYRFKDILLLFNLTTLE